MAKERDGNSGLSSTTGTTCKSGKHIHASAASQGVGNGRRQQTDSVDVGLDCCRHLPIDDERDIGDIDTTTSLRGGSNYLQPRTKCQKRKRRRTHEIGGDQNIVGTIAQTLKGSLTLFLVLA